MVEAAIALPVFLWILFAMLDFGIAAVRSNALSDAARRVGRDAIIHGNMSHPSIGTWGPNSISMTADSDLPATQSIKQTLPTMPIEDVEVNLSWPDGKNRPHDRVHVHLRYTHESIVPGVLPWGPWELNTSTTMSIVN